MKTFGVAITVVHLSVYVFSFLKPGLANDSATQSNENFSHTIYTLKGLEIYRNLYTGIFVSG